MQPWPLAATPPCPVTQTHSLSSRGSRPQHVHFPGAPLASKDLLLEQLIVVVLSLLTDPLGCPGLGLRLLRPRPSSVGLTPSILCEVLRTLGMVPFGVLQKSLEDG